MYLKTLLKIVILFYRVIIDQKKGPQNQEVLDFMNYVTSLKYASIWLRKDKKSARIS